MVYVNFFGQNEDIMFICEGEYRPIIDSDLINYKPIVSFRRPIAANELPTLRRKIKGTEYIISGKLSAKARETAKAKMRRLILNEPIED